MDDDDDAVVEVPQEHLRRTPMPKTPPRDMSKIKGLNVSAPIPLPALQKKKKLQKTSQSIKEVQRRLFKLMRKKKKKVKQVRAKMKAPCMATAKGNGTLPKWKGPPVKAKAKPPPKAAAKPPSKAVAKPPPTAETKPPPKAKTKLPPKAKGTPPPNMLESKAKASSKGKGKRMPSENARVNGQGKLAEDVFSPPASPASPVRMPESPTEDHLQQLHEMWPNFDEDLIPESLWCCCFVLVLHACMCAMITSCVCACVQVLCLSLV